MPSISDLRKQYQEYADLGDAEIVNSIASKNGASPEYVADYLGYSLPKSNAAKSLSSGIDRYQAGLYHIPAALGSEWAAKQARANEAEANLVDSTNDAVKSWKDVHSIGDFGSFVKHGGIQTLPYIAEAIGTGLTGGGTAAARAVGQAGLRTFGGGAVERGIAERALADGAGEIVARQQASEAVANGYARSAAAGVGSYPSSVGALLSRQHEENGDYDFGTAAAMGVPYAALNMVGLEGQMLRGMPRGLSTSALKRGGVGFVEGAVPEAGAEMAQTFLERTGAGLKPFEGSGYEYIDSGILGGMLGGAPGSVNAAVRGPAISKQQQTDLLSLAKTRDESFGQTGIDYSSPIYDGSTVYDQPARAQGQMFDMLGGETRYAPVVDTPSTQSVVPSEFNPAQQTLFGTDLLGDTTYPTYGQQVQENPELVTPEHPFQQAWGVTQPATREMFYPDGAPTYAANAQLSETNDMAYRAPRVNTDGVPLNITRSGSLREAPVGSQNKNATVLTGEAQGTPTQQSLIVPTANPVDTQIAAARSYEAIKAKQARGEQLSQYEIATLRAGAPTVTLPNTKTKLELPVEQKVGNRQLTLSEQTRMNKAYGFTPSIKTVPVIQAAERALANGHIDQGQFETVLNIPTPAKAQAKLNDVIARNVQASTEQPVAAAQPEVISAPPTQQVAEKTVPAKKQKTKQESAPTPAAPAVDPVTPEPVVETKPAPEVKQEKPVETKPAAVMDTNTARSIVNKHDLKSDDGVVSALRELMQDPNVPEKLAIQAEEAIITIEEAEDATERSEEIDVNRQWLKHDIGAHKTRAERKTRTSGDVAAVPKVGSLAEQLRGASGDSDVSYSRQSLTYKLPNGKVVSDYVDDLDTSEFPQFQNVLDAVRSSTNAAMLNVVSGFYVNRSNDSSYVYKNADGTYKIVMAESTLKADDAFCKLILDHELTHAAEGATGTTLGFYSTTSKIGTAVARARALYNRLGVNTDLGWHFDYPFNSAHPESADYNKLRNEITAQLVSAYLNPTLNAALAKEDAVLFNIAKEAHDEITKDAASKPAGNRIDPVAQGYVQSAPVFNRATERQGSRSEKAAAGTEGAIESRLPPEAKAVYKGTKAWLKEKAGNLMLGGMFGHDLESFAEKYMPDMVRPYFTSLWNKMNERNRLENIALKVGEAFYDLSAKHQRAVDAFISESRVSKQWGFVPEWLTEKDGAVPKAEGKAKEMFDALQQESPEAAEVAKAAFKAGFDIAVAHRNTIRQRIEETSKDVKQLKEKKSGATEEEIKQADAQIKQLEDNHADMVKLTQMPYVPLYREGTHFVSVKSQELLAMEAKVKAAENGDGKALKKLKEEMAAMRGDKNHYQYMMRDSYEAHVLHAKLQQDPELKDHQVIVGATLPEAQELTEIPHKMVDRMASLLSHTKDAALTGAAKIKLQRELNDLYINYLMQDNPLKHQLKSDGVHGYETDMVRGFLNVAKRQSAVIAAIGTQRDITDALYKIQGDARSDRTGNAATKRMIATEITKRYLNTVRYRETPFQNAVMRINSVWMLLTSPAYYVQNATQPFTTSLPIMAAKHGSKAAGILMDAYRKDATKIAKHGWKLEGVLTGDELKMANALEDRGRLSFGADVELGELATKPSAFMPKAVSKSLRAMYNAAQKVERVNRVTTALAAYRLEMAATNNHEKAVAYAEKVVLDTHGDYSSANTPRWFQQGDKALPVKMMLQFKKFQLIQLSLMAKVTRDAFFAKKEANETDADFKLRKAIGRKMVTYLFGTYGTLAGLSGLPAGALLTPLVASILGAAGDDKDDSEDSEAYLRKKIGDKFWADLFLKGMPASLGLDVSTKLGMGNILSPLPFVEAGKTSKETLTNYLWGVVGPTGALAQRAATGVEYLGKGDYWKGLETLAPRGFKDLSAAVRYQTEGLTDKKGDMLYSPDDISALQSVMQAVGLPTKQLTDRQWRANVKYKTEADIQGRAGEVKHMAEEAFRSGDSEAIDAAREAFADLQKSKRDLGFKTQKMSDFYNYRKDLVKRERNTVDGMQYTKSNERFVRNLSEQ